MTRHEAKRILDQHREGKLFLPRTIRQALSVSENSATLDPYGYDDGLERAYMVESEAVGE